MKTISKQLMQEAVKLSAEWNNTAFFVVNDSGELDVAIYNHYQHEAPQRKIVAHVNGNDGFVIKDEAYTWEVAPTIFESGGNTVQEAILRNIATTTDNKLEKYVAEYLLNSFDTDEEREIFIEDLATHGCASGMVSELTYYEDTVKFHDEFNEEIWELLNHIKEQLDNDKNTLEFIATLNGAHNVVSIDTFKNQLAWLAFEEMVCMVYIKFEQ